MDRTTKGLFAIILCAILWSTGGLFIKLIDWHPMVIAGSRSSIAALFMLIVRLLRPARYVQQSSATGAKPISSISSNRFGFWGAAIAYSTTMILFVIANKATASANVILLQYTAPIYAALLGWALLKEKPRTEHWLGLGAVSVGLVFFFKDGLASPSLFGDGLALLSGISFALYSVFMRMQKDGNPADSALFAHVLSAVVGLPFIFIHTPHLSIQSVLAVFGLGVLQLGIPSLLFSYGIRRVSAVQAMLAAVVEPVLNPVWVLLATGEAPGPAAIAGGTVILFAVTLTSIIGLRNARQLRRAQ